MIHYTNRRSSLYGNSYRGSANYAALCSSSSSSSYGDSVVELLITAGGENISPILIEDAVREQLPCVSSCMLIGDRRKFLSLLITLKVRLVCYFESLIVVVFEMTCSVSCRTLKGTSTLKNIPRKTNIYQK